MLGYFRDDTPLIELILDEKGKQELDTLWAEFEFIGDYTLRNYTQFVFSGSGGGRNLMVDRGKHQGFATQEAVFALRDQHLAKATAETDPRILEAIRQYFDNANSRIRQVEKARLAAEPRHLDALLQFAVRAYRRPLAQAERDEILAYYRQSREQSGLTHEEAMRASIASLLVSPDFLYRVDLVDLLAKNAAGRDGAKSAAAYRPLSAYSLASRLSYFLWSSLPDDELLTHAAAGDLDKPAVLIAQVRRMLKDERARGMATEFGGNWLDFRRFEDHNAVDRERFPVFTNQLREAMFEEPIRFIADLIQQDRPAQELLYGRHTFVNGVLARHYGMPASSAPDKGQDTWFRVDNARDYGRGGLLPMAVFLTRNAPGLRTSPVKRGYWIARRVLGEVIPPPPPTVPELPRDEATSNLPVRELLAKHRNNVACAGCHARFDSFGLVFEAYGPVGERRTSDLAGRVVDARAEFPNGTQGAGIEGLQAYIRNQREKDFLNNLNEKLLSFALGRSLMISDEPLLEAMQAKLTASGYRMSALIETIVTSPQFLNKRTLAYNQPKAIRDFSEERKLKMPDRKNLSNSKITRRAILQGAGVTMALPWLESFAAKAKTRDEETFPKRFGVIFLGCGVNEDHWGSAGSGPEMKLSKSLSPLEPLKSKLNVIHGLFNKHNVGLGVHPPQTGSLLTGAVLTKGATIRSGISVDQMIASRMGQETLQPSMVLACEQSMTGFHETNYSNVYSSHISWQSAESPVPNEIYPSLAFDMLFENRGSLLNLSILDRVKERAERLSGKISSSDNAKLDEYLTSVREVEKRVEGMRKAKDKADDLAKLKNRPVWSMERPANGLPEDLREHAKLMLDLIAIAFQTDKTRVATLILSRDLSGRSILSLM